jgi:hypothetical protein
MDRQDVAIVVNTTPKYFPLLEAHFGLLRRYASRLNCGVFLATEAANELTIQMVTKRFGINVIRLDSKMTDFFESRLAAVESLPAAIKYVLPLQEDFLLERPGPNYDALKEAVEIMGLDTSVKGVRLMPCPASSTAEKYQNMSHWDILGEKDLQFSYQATIWRRDVWTTYMRALIAQTRELQPSLRVGTREYNQYAIRSNPAETFIGLSMLKHLFPGGKFLCWARVGAYANAVYACPWPYRPTAVVHGVLEKWAAELIRREGFGVVNI